MAPRGHLSPRTTRTSSWTGRRPMPRSAYLSSILLPSPARPFPAGKALQVPKPVQARRERSRDPRTSGPRDPGTPAPEGAEGLGGGAAARTGGSGEASLGRAGVPSQTSGARPYCAHPLRKPATHPQRLGGGGGRVSGPRRARPPSWNLSGGSGGLSDGGRLGRRGLKRSHHRGDVEGSVGAGGRQPEGRQSNDRSVGHVSRGM